VFNSRQFAIRGFDLAQIKNIDFPISINAGLNA
jgi:hypothetical protein